MSPTDRLSLEALPELLVRLGVDPLDREPISVMVAQLLADRAARDEVDRLAAELLLAGLGQWEDSWQRPGFAPSTPEDRWMEGGPALCALLATAADVHDHHRSRGIDAEVSWASLADLGQQVTKHRLVRGSTGLTQANWLRNVWAGDFVRLGRLQFELYRVSFDDAPGPVQVLNTHIPGDGSMAPGAVGASLAAAAGFYREHYADQLDDLDGRGPGVAWIYCQSWLLDRELAALLPSSNIADFAERWEPAGGIDHDRDGYYFVFNIEPGADEQLPGRLDELPQRTSLERALVAHWRAGKHLRQARGRIPAR
ncbi:acyltransferase domain-containing protein [Aestuariimicrobium sp. Y1814]|uniref:acyltransferase domain-containing protein n=1 Tax=Aestuariimicrobium sp. Y1814 TaxID=3418742 RepID=UPI003DA771E5